MHQHAVQQGVSVRPFIRTDLPRVLELLNAALGGGPAGRRPPEFFEWKHLQNPFGPSLLLVAEQDNQLIGLRAFMRWRFVTGGRSINAVRAVDTATHPNHQGKGAFSRLTRTALETLGDEVDLVFNTPNGKSGPGYLKMGWREVGRVPVAIRVRHPLRLLAGGCARIRPEPPARAELAARVLERTASVAGLLEREPVPAGLATARGLDYMRWRYGAAPLLGYRAVTEERDGRLVGLAVFRVRRRGRHWESTVTELLAGDDGSTARRLLRGVVRAAPVDHLTMHVPARSPLARAALTSGFLPAPAGVRLVVNPLGGGIGPDPADLGSWSLSLGDIEVF